MIRPFTLSGCAILWLTGAAKIWSGLGNSKLLAELDPVTGLKFGTLMLVVGVIEIGIALICFFNKRQAWSLGLIAWISSGFLAYRICLWMMDWQRPCSCLGNLTDALHISPQVADNIIKVLLAYLLMGSSFLLLQQWLRTSTSVRPAKPLHIQEEDDSANV